MKPKAICVGILLSIIFVFNSNAQQSDFPLLKGPYLDQKPPGDTPVLFAPGTISTGKEHSAAMFTPDGGVLWILAPGAYSAQGLHKKPIILEPPSGGIVLSN